MRKSGINSHTPEDFLLGAGTVFKNLQYVYKKVDEEDIDKYDNVLEVVADDESDVGDKIKIGKIKNPGVSFIGTHASYVNPQVGDFVVGAWDDSESHVLGATNGGNKLSIIPEMTPIEVDGATVKVKGLTQKTGESATLETNLAQHTEESFKRAIVGEEKESLIKGYKQIQTKSLLELSDYIDNLAFVGNMSDGTDVIIIMENVVCTSGFDTQNTNKEASVFTATFEASADFKSGVYDTLPVYIFYPEKEGR